MGQRPGLGRLSHPAGGTAGVQGADQHRVVLEDIEDLGGGIVVAGDQQLVLRVVVNIRQAQSQAAGRAAEDPVDHITLRVVGGADIDRIRRGARGAGVGEIARLGQVDSHDGVAAGPKAGPAGQILHRGEHLLSIVPEDLASSLEELGGDEEIRPCRR